MALSKAALKQLNIRGPTPEALGITLLGDNFLVAEDFDFWRDENHRGHEEFSMRPHCRVREYGGAYGLDEGMYVKNLSRQGATLEELGEESWNSNWVKEMQWITILQVGLQDLFRGNIPKEEFQEDGKLILKMVRKAIINMREKKISYLEKVAPRKLELWKKKHHFGIYSLPNLKDYSFEGTGWTFEEYKKVARQQNRYLKDSRDKKYLSYSILSPDIKEPSFDNRRKGNFPGFPYLKLEESLMRCFVAPILELVRKKYCSRCRDPLLPESLWKDKWVTPANGVSSIVHWIPREIWGQIFKWLTVFDVWTMKETCKGLYRIHHNFLKCGRPLVLREEEDEDTSEEED